MGFMAMGFMGTGAHPPTVPVGADMLGGFDLTGLRHVPVRLQRTAIRSNA